MPPRAWVVLILIVWAVTVWFLLGPVLGCSIDKPC